MAVEAGAIKFTIRSCSDRDTGSACVSRDTALSLSRLLCCEASQTIQFMTKGRSCLQDPTDSDENRQTDPYLTSPPGNVSPCQPECPTCRGPAAFSLGVSFGVPVFRVCMASLGWCRLLFPLGIISVPCAPAGRLQSRRPGVSAPGMPYTPVVQGVCGPGALIVSALRSAPPQEDAGHLVPHSRMRMLCRGLAAGRGLALAVSPCCVTPGKSVGSSGCLRLLAQGLDVDSICRCGCMFVRTEKGTA